MQTQRLQGRGRGLDKQNVGKSNLRVWRTLAAGAAGFVVVLIFVYSFTLLCQVLAAVHGTFDLDCGMQDLFLFVACGSFSWDTGNLDPWQGIKPGPPPLVVWSLSHWTTGKSPDVFWACDFVIRSVQTTDGMRKFPSSLSPMVVATKLLVLNCWPKNWIVLMHQSLFEGIGRMPLGDEEKNPKGVLGKLCSPSWVGSPPPGYFSFPFRQNPSFLVTKCRGRVFPTTSNSLQHQLSVPPCNPALTLPGLWPTRLLPPHFRCQPPRSGFLDYP